MSPAVNTRASTFGQPAVDDHGLRALMGYFPTGVTILGSHADGRDQGMTANSLTSVSLDPPLVAVCVSHGSRTAKAIDSSGGFAVTFLARDQEELARRFARNDDDHFSGVATARTRLGHPYLPQGIGFIECTVRERVAAGDHTVVIGHVVESTLSGGEPLVFFRSKLCCLSQGADTGTESSAKERQ
jgi:flavin reductase (DIM6/NTAB) family NADH-FMN oxidoreductase RutF